jgi:beta-galactosidase
MRIPKDGYYAHQVMWNGWVDPAKPAIFIMGHWNYAAGTVKPVYVVAADAARVELKLNGKVLGNIKASPFNFNQSLARPAGAKPVDALRREPVIPPGQSNDFLFTFPGVAFAPGTLEAIAYDDANKPVATCQLHTAGAPAAIRLTPHTGPGGLHADGSDLAMIDVEIIDARGQRVPTADPMISFDLTGPAEWRGGIAPPPAGVNAMTFSNYILATTLPVENGINRVIVRSKPLGGTAPGVITLNASSPGLASANVTLHSQPVPVLGGISTYNPAGALHSYLDRGPTPAGSSVHTTRTSIEVASATAGSNADKAMLSHDDNETITWSSDGRIVDAWIEYTFTQPSAPTQMDIKLTAFRTRRYPLRVTLGGTTLYEGITPNSLGYITIPLQQG